jgi:hypothetical protein
MVADPNWVVGYLKETANNGIYSGYWYPEQKGLFDISVWRLCLVHGCVGGDKIVVFIIKYVDTFVFALNTHTHTHSARIDLLSVIPIDFVGLGLNADYVG